MQEITMIHVWIAALLGSTSGALLGRVIAFYL